MTGAIIFRPRNRLAKILAGAEGTPVEDLIAASEKRVGDLAEGLRAYVMLQLKDLLRLQACPEAEIKAGCGSLGVMAMNIAEVAGAAGMNDIGAAARGICAITEAHFEGGFWHFEALKLHLASLALLAAPLGPGPEEAAKVLGRLRDLRLSLGIPD